MNSKTRLAMSLVVAIAIGSSGCLEDFEEPLPPRDDVYFPIGTQMHPDGRFLYVVNSNFDLRYRSDQGGTVSVIDTEEMEIVGDASPFVPSFGAHVALNEEGTRAYVPSRHNDELTVLNVADQGQAMYCEVDGERSVDTRPCTVSRIPDTGQGTSIPSDPFGVSVGQMEREGTSFDVVYLSHLVGQEVTAIALPDGDISGASMRNASLMDEGGNFLALRPGTDQAYVAGRGAYHMRSYSPFLSDFGEMEALIQGPSVELKQRSASIDARGVAFDEEGDWMFVTTRSPAALHMVRLDDGAKVVNTIALERQPSEVHAHRGADGALRLYIPSFEFGVVEVVDAEKEAVVDIIDVGRSPYSVATDLQPFHCVEPGERCRAYVTLFDAKPDDPTRRCDGEDDDDIRCGAVAVIDLDPESDSFHSVIDIIE